jgi:hypothetical protein
MLANTCLASIEAWIQSCEGLVPLEVSADHPQRQSLRSLIDSNAKFRGNWSEAILGLRIGSIDRTHEIVQHGATSMDRYLHGVVHRIEGDFWNSKYWFRQVGDQELLAQIGLEVSSTLHSLCLFESAKPLKLFDEQNRFAASNLVDAQAALPGKSTLNERALIQQIAQAEWNALWKIIQHSL